MLSLRLVCQLASHRKDLLEVTHLKQLAERTDFGNILHLRRLVMFVLAFYGFFRSSELCLICIKHVQFFYSYVTIFIKKSKTDKLDKTVLSSSLKPVRLLVLAIFSWRT